VNIIADTNILARAALDDDPRRSGVARKLLAEAETISVPLLAFCELAWLMSRTIG
jgi:predicted nucleic acid-binding protein